MYSEVYKNWIACESESLPIVKLINSFKEYWSGAIALINQMAALASQHGYGMAAVNNDSNSAWLLASSPQATSTPPHSTSAHPTIAETDAMAKVKAAAGPLEATNSQPGMVLAGRVHRNPHVRPLPTSIGKLELLPHAWQ
jgi:hypothetical protein